MNGEPEGNARRGVRIAGMSVKKIFSILIPIFVVFLAVAIYVGVRRSPEAQTNPDEALANAYHAIMSVSSVKGAAYANLSQSGRTLFTITYDFDSNPLLGSVREDFQGGQTAYCTKNPSGTRYYLANGTESKSGICMDTLAQILGEAIKGSENVSYLGEAVWNGEDVRMISFDTNMTLFALTSEGLDLNRLTFPAHAGVLISKTNGIPVMLQIAYKTPTEMLSETGLLQYSLAA